MVNDDREVRFRPRRLDAIGRDRSGFGRLMRRTEAYLALNRRIAPVIPASARGEIGIACIDGDCVVIAAASPARATQARLAAGDILNAARRFWPEPLARTRIIVTPGIELDLGD